MTCIETNCNIVINILQRYRPCFNLRHFSTVAFSVPPVFPRTASTISTKRPCRGVGIVSMGLRANILADAVLYGLMMIAFHSEIRTMIVRIDRSTLLHTGFDKAIQRFTVG